MTRRDQPGHYQALAARRGFQWLGPDVPRTTKHKTMWRCAEGHVWAACYNDLHTGTGCPRCAGMVPKTAADYETLAAERGLEWVGETLPRQVDTKTTWVCRTCGHRWRTTYTSLAEGAGCPLCYQQTQRHGPEAYRALAEGQGLEWRGPPARNVTIKTGWRCRSCGHQWLSTYNVIRRGHGCPACRQRARQQARAQKATSKPKPKRRLGRKPKTEADYHELAESRGFEWLGPLPQNTVHPTWWRCPAGHEWETRYNNIRQGSGCPACASNAPKREADYEALAAERGFEWVGERLPPNTGHKTTWQCGAGHRWQASYNNIQKRRGCPACGRSRTRPPDYEALAATRGFEWLGPLVATVKTPTGWRCPAGHEWQARYADIRRGGGCPICHREQTRRRDP